MSRRSKRILLTLAVVVAIGIGGYAGAPALAAAVAAHYLDDFFEVRELRIESVGPTRLEVAAVRVDNERMRLQAHQGTVRYELWPFRIRGVEIHRVRLTLMDGAAASSGDAQTMAPAPPSFPVHIDELLLETQTPWGALSIPASITSRREAVGGFRMRVGSEGVSAVLASADQQNYQLDVRNARGEELLSLEAGLGSGYPVDFAGRIDPGLAAAWLRESPVPPPGVKSVLEPYRVESGDVRFDGTLLETLDFTARLRGALAVRDERAPAQQIFERVEVDAASGYEISRSGAAWSGSGDAAFRLALAPGTTLTGGSPRWQLGAGGLELDVSEPALVELGLAAASIRVSTPGFSGSGAEGRISAQGLHTDAWPAGLAFYDGSGDWSFDGTTLRASGSGSGPGLPGLSWEAESGPDRGRVEVTSEGPVAALSSTIQAYTRALARETTIASGELSARYRYEWNGERQETTLTASAGPVDANLDEMELRGLRVELANQGTTLERLRLDVSAPTLKLAAGTVAKELRMEMRLALPVVNIDTARTRLFGGEISVRPTSIDLDKSEFTLFADIVGLSLERVVGLFDLESTQLTGEVSGPVRVVYHKDRGVAINEGELHNDEPGVLRLTLNPGSETAQQMNNIALRALENFQYRELNASVLYTPDGQYRVKARILGHNPKVLDGHPIALNPTIEGRLPALFRAFFITGDFNRAIIEKLQEERSLSTSGEASTLQNE